MNKKGKILSTKGISRKNKNEASSLSMRMVIMIISCDILKNKSNLFLGFSLSTGEYLPYEQKMGVTGIHEIHFCYTHRINLSINTWNYTWLAQTPQHPSGKHRENPDLKQLYLPAYCKRANIRSRKITPQNSNQLAREMELPGENQPRTRTDRSLGIKY